MQLGWTEAELLDLVVCQELAEVLCFAAVQISNGNRVVCNGPEELLQQRQLVVLHLPISRG